MTDTAKRTISAIFATLITAAALAVSQDVIPPAYHKLAVYIVGVLGIIGTTLLPALTGAAVRVPPIVMLAVLLAATPVRADDGGIAMQHVSAAMQQPPAAALNPAIPLCAEPSKPIPARDDRAFWTAMIGTTGTTIAAIVSAIIVHYTQPVTMGMQ